MLHISKMLEQPVQKLIAHFYTKTHLHVSYKLMEATKGLMNEAELITIV